MLSDIRNNRLVSSPTNLHTLDFTYNQARNSHYNKGMYQYFRHCLDIGRLYHTYIISTLSKLAEAAHEGSSRIMLARVAFGKKAVQTPLRSEH